MVGITEQSSAISGTNITDYHIAMVGDDGTFQTEEYTCDVYIQVFKFIIIIIAAKLVRTSFHKTL